MRLKVDENLGFHETSILRNGGHDVATVPEEGLCSASDDKVAGHCVSEGRCLVTLDLDFANPIRFPPAARPGIIVIRTPPRGGQTAIDTALHTMLRALDVAEIQGKLWVVEPGRIREYSI